MDNEINPGDRVEVTRLKKGGFYVGRYLATVIRPFSKGRIRVSDDEGKIHLPYHARVRKLI